MSPGDTWIRVRLLFQQSSLSGRPLVSSDRHPCLSVVGHHHSCYLIRRLLRVDFTTWLVSLSPAAQPGLYTHTAFLSLSGIPLGAASSSSGSFHPHKTIQSLGVWGQAKGAADKSRTLLSDLSPLSSQLWDPELSPCSYQVRVLLTEKISPQRWLCLCFLKIHVSGIPLQLQWDWWSNLSKPQSPHLWNGTDKPSQGFQQCLSEITSAGGPEPPCWVLNEKGCKLPSSVWCLSCVTPLGLSPSSFRIFL